MKISTLTADERKALMAELEKEEKAEQAKRLREKKKHEKTRDADLEDLWFEGKELSLAIARYKGKVHVVMDKQRDALNEYGGIRTNSQGGFSLTHSNQNIRITRRRDTDPSWDERAIKAVTLIKDFLLSKGIKKSAGPLHEVLMEYIEKNDQGDLEYAKVMSLLKHEHLFQDPRWVKGLQLIREGYSITFKKFNYEFKEKSAHGKWVRLEMNFSSL